VELELVANAIQAGRRIRACSPPAAPSFPPRGSIRLARLSPAIRLLEGLTPLAAICTLPTG